MTAVRREYPIQFPEKHSILVMQSDRDGREIVIPTGCLTVP
jgi:hypothetical protein